MGQSTFWHKLWQQKYRAQKAIYEYHEYFWCYPETKPWEASPIKAGWLLESGGHREMQIDCL